MLERSRIYWRGTLGVDRDCRDTQERTNAVLNFPKVED